MMSVGCELTTPLWQISCEIRLCVQAVAKIPGDLRFILGIWRTPFILICTVRKACLRTIMNWWAQPSRPTLRLACAAGVSGSGQIPVPTLQKIYPGELKAGRYFVVAKAIDENRFFPLAEMPP
jgi:hypothetical protein